MKWKEILIGAALTLAVTLVGGILLYYYTKEPDDKKSERLVYSIQAGGSFKGGSQEFSVAAIRVLNIGGVAAKRVALSVMLDAATIRDLSIVTDAGSKEISRKVKDKNIQLQFETLLPSEALTVNLLLSLPEKPAVSVRSEATLGTEKLLEVSKVTRAGKVNYFLERMVPLTGAFLASMMIVVLVVARRIGALEAMSTSKNNAGFLLLHHGLVDDAESILSSAVHSGRYDIFTLSNLALCKALKGQHEDAQRLIRAANFRDRSGHGKAVILFNEALISLVGGNKDGAIAKLKEAINRSPKHIRLYCQRSVHLDSVRNEPAFYDLIKSA